MSSLPDLSNIEAVNRQNVDELMGRASDGEPLFFRLLGIYKEETPSLLEQLEKSYASRDVDLAYESIHQIKGSSAAMGATRVFELAQAALELAGGEQVFAETELVGRLRREYELYVTEVANLLKR